MQSICGPVFRPGLGVVLLTLQCITETLLEFGFAFWVTNLDLRNAVGKIQSNFRPAALRGKDFFKSISVFGMHYMSRNLVFSIFFSIKRDVKQRDVLSLALFNSGLGNLMFLCFLWKRRLVAQGVDVGPLEGLTDIRYADDILVFAKFRWH